MAAREPRIFINDTTEPIAKFMVCALPQGTKRARRRHDRVVVNPVAGTYLGDLVRHPGATSDAVDEPFCPFQHPMQDALSRGHLPQYVHVDAAFAVGAFVGDAGLLDSARDRV